MARAVSSNEDFPESIHCARAGADRVGGASELLSPLIEALSRYVLSADKLHADDTRVPVLAPGRGTTKQAPLWTCVRDDRPSGSKEPPAVLMRYSPDRNTTQHTPTSSKTGMAVTCCFISFARAPTHVA